MAAYKQDRMQTQRFERKYFVTERQALEIRDFVRGYLQPDENTKGRINSSYPVHSLYLDSEELTTFWATVHCEKKRFKLRVRYYNDDLMSPLFFEIKRRENECVLKQRGVVHREAGALLLSGQLPGPEHLVSDKPEHLAALQRFCYLMQRLQARPKMHVAYWREAWVNAQGSVRVTLDRQVRGEDRHEATFRTPMARPVFPFGKRLVLELKFTDRFPDWFNEMVRHFNLLQTGAPKYCGSVAITNEQTFPNPDLARLQQRLAEVARIC